MRYKNGFSLIILLLFCSTVICLAGNQIYNYDNAGRLIRVHYDNNAEIQYVYDDAGNLISRTVSICIHDGDVNSDGINSAGDAQQTFYFVLGMATPTHDEACSADCNNDGNITSADAQQIFLAALGGSCASPPDSARK